MKSTKNPTTKSTTAKTDRNNAFTRLGLYKDAGISKEAHNKDIDDLVMDLAIDIEQLIELIVDVELYYRKNQKIQSKVKQLIPIKTIKDKNFTYITPLEHQEKLYGLATLCDDFGNLLHSLTEDGDGDYYNQTHINNFLRSPTRYNHYIKGLMILHLNECDKMKKQLDFLELVLTNEDVVVKFDKDDYADPEDYVEVWEHDLDGTTFIGRIIKKFEMETIAEEEEVVNIAKEHNTPLPTPVPTPAPRRYNTRSTTNPKPILKQTPKKRPRKSVKITTSPTTVWRECGCYKEI